MKNLKNQKVRLISAELIFVGMFSLASIFLASQLGEQTKFSSSGKLFSQPAFWPAIGVLGMSIFSIFHIVLNLHRISSSNPAKEIMNWVRSLEFLGWFMVYVFFVPLLGYLISTILFTTLLAFRMGYRKSKILFFAFSMGVSIVVIFKTILSVKIPGGLLYEFLPGIFRNFMIVNF